MWYNRVVSDLSQIPNFIDYYEKELLSAKGEIAIRGNVEKAASNLPGITEHRFNQLQEIEAILNYLNIQLRKIRQKHYKKYLEAYARALTSRDAEKYAELEKEKVKLETEINRLKAKLAASESMISVASNKMNANGAGSQQDKAEIAKLTPLQPAGILASLKPVK
jgi:uncharacterized protein YfdQ (DUF2303 family)